MSDSVQLIHAVQPTDLPSGWSSATIEALVGKEGVFVDGDWVESKDQDPTGDVRLIQLADIGDGEYRNKSDRFLTHEKALELGCTFLNKDDVLIARMPDPLGRACIFPGDRKKSVTVVDVAIARSGKGEFNHRWLMYFINAPDFRSSVASLQSGSTRKRISRGNLARITLPVPPREHQNRIVAEIEKQFSRLDEAAATLKRVKANLKCYKAAVLKAAVEGKLVPTEAEIAQSEGRPYESAGHLIARTEVPPRPNRYTTRSKDIIPGHAALAVGNPGSPLPVGWAWSPLVEIARMETGHTPSREHPEWWDGDIPWIGIADAREHHGQVINETVQHTNEGGLANSAARLLPTGTVCVSRTASVGYVVVMGRPMATSQDFVNWVPTQAVTSDWLRVIFLADRDALIRFGRGSVHKTIYFPEWLSVYVGVPPRAEQDRIVAEVDRRLSAISAFESAVSNNMKRAEHLRQSILRDAFLGRLVPGEPTDEPASILLERIRVEEIAKSLLLRESMHPKRKRRIGVMGEKEKRSLLEVLSQHPNGITPEALLSASNYSIDEVDVFYSELSELYEELEERKPEGNALFAWPYDAKVTLRLKAK